MNMKIIIRDSENNLIKEAVIVYGMLLSELLKKEGLYIDMPCGGMGRCGKCVVRFISPDMRITDADRRYFTDEEIADGYRLACRAVLTDNCEVMIFLEKNISSVNKITCYGDDTKEALCDEKNVGIAIDLGTTTIAGAIMAECDDDKSLITQDYENCTKTAVMNHQRIYGADVISRIKAANEGNAKELKSLVTDDINDVVSALCKKTKYKNNIERIILAGNTTMLHLFMGDSCEGLGRSPYTPSRLEYPTFEHNGIQVEIFPGISAFVGADIVSGLYALGFDDIPKGQIYMLIDLGTNGEMAVADSEKITACSTAAGPVFEGGGISCGMAGIPGAIEHVTIEKSQAHIDVIEGAEPCGICGSGVLELVSELRRQGIIDETGLLAEEYFDDGFVIAQRPGTANGKIRFTRNDIRAVQLAKAAIRSGIDTLLKEHGCTYDMVTRVYLAGGFGEHLLAEKIRYLRLLPDSFLDRGILTIAGNTSLLGCFRALSDPLHKEKIKEIRRKTSEITLAETDAFGNAFINNMNF